MQKRVKQSKKSTKKKKRASARPMDVNQAAFLQVERSTQETEGSQVPLGLSEYMAKIGSKGGKIGGKRRLETITPAERSEIALKAAKARWAKRTDKPA